MKYCNEFALINDTPEVREEYKRRHDELWPEMRELIAEAGLYNYTIWNVGARLIDYYECDDLARAKAILRKSDVKKRWDAYMKDLIVCNPDGSFTPLEKVFEIN